MFLHGTRIIVVDDDREVLGVIRALLSGQGCTVDTAEGGSEALNRMRRRVFDVCLADLMMPKMDGLELLDHIRRDHPGTEVILITGYASIDSAVEAMKKGAVDYLPKPLEPEKLFRTISRAKESRRFRIGSERRQQQTDHPVMPEKIVGESPMIQEVRRQIRDLSQHEISVLIQGETGTGKGLVARWIYYESARKHGPFVEVNCGSLSEAIAESELFGHERGAFTGAHERHQGRFELAEGGALFLDDVANLNLDIQRKLLRVLEEKEFERVGGEKTLRTDVRLLCASNQDLEEQVRLGSFREDLYYRIAVLPMKLPPLRERGEDVVVLAKHHLGRYVQEMEVGSKRLSERAVDVLRAYPWPGNVRELRNVIQQVLVFHRGEEIGPDDFPLEIREGRRRVDPSSGTLKTFVGAYERSCIEEALRGHRGNATRTAQALGISRETLYTKMRRYAIERRES